MEGCATGAVPDFAGAHEAGCESDEKRASEHEAAASAHGKLELAVAAVNGHEAANAGAAQEIGLGTGTEGETGNLPAGESASAPASPWAEVTMHGAAGCDGKESALETLTMLAEASLCGCEGQRRSGLRGSHRGDHTGKTHGEKERTGLGEATRGADRLGSRVGCWCEWQTMREVAHAHTHRASSDRLHGGARHAGVLGHIHAQAHG